MTGWTWERFEAVVASRCDAVALRHGDARLTFRDLGVAAKAQASELALEPGARVIVMAENGPALAALVPAIWYHGGIVVLVHADAPTRHLAHAVEAVQPAAIFADRTELLCEGPALQPLALVGGPGIKGKPRHRRSGDDPASILFTSGSTGLPKGVTQPARNLVDGAARMSRLLGYCAEDRILCPVPFAFDYGWGQLLSLLLEGIPLVLPEPRNAFGVCAALEAHAPTVLAGVPAVFADLIAGLAPIRETSRGSVRLITNTGSKLPKPVFETLAGLFPDAEMSLNYGLTETYRSASLPPKMARSHPDAVGFPVPGVEIEIRRPDGTQAAPGEEGEIVHRGAGVFAGYWGDPLRTKAVRHDEDGTPTVLTGDLGRIDSDGLLYVHGRRDRQIKSMGVRVSPDEVETLLLESGAVAEVAVTALPHELFGQMIVACVVPAAGQDDEKALLKQLRAHARAQMSVYMQPRRYVVLPALPRTRSAKVDYSALWVRLMEESEADQAKGRPPSPVRAVEPGVER